MSPPSTPPPEMGMHLYMYNYDYYLDLLNAWVYSVAVKKWQDVAVIIAPDQLTQVQCSNESGGRASRGWDCLYATMPHMCIFNSSEVRF